MYEFTLENARMKGLSLIQLEMFRALQDNPAMRSQFFGLFSGVVSPTDFFTPPEYIPVAQTARHGENRLERHLKFAESRGG